MQVTASYNGATLAAKSSVTSIPTSETTLMTITDAKYLMKSQIAFLISVAPGSSTGVKIRYYASVDGLTYYPIPSKNVGTGVLTDLPSELTSASYVDASSNWVATDELPMPACMAFKVTGQSVTATATLNSAWLVVRDN